VDLVIDLHDLFSLSLGNCLCARPSPSLHCCCLQVACHLYL